MDEPTNNISTNHDETKKDKLGNRQHSNRSENIKKTKFLTIALFFIASLGVGFVGGWFGSHSNKQSNTTIQKEVISQQGNIIRQVSSEVGQSVVSINDTQVASSNDISPFGVFGAAPSTQQVAGTGIILSSSGYIVTNRHVVPDGTSSVTVTLSDGTVFKNVRIIGRTSSTDNLDVAILKIEDTKGKKLIPANLGDSSKTQVGDSVIAIGNALGQFQNTVTSGIISGFGRSIKASSSDGSSSENLDGLIQTDAAINEGNSGGPLANLSGEVIGLNVATAGGAQNIGFSIPINDINGIIQSVLTTGKFARPYIGVLYVPIDPTVKEKYNLSVDQGGYILPSSITGQPGIVPGSPADNAGLKEGDIITKVNNNSMKSTTTLTSLLDNYTVGTKVDLTVIRDGKTIHVPVVIGSAPSN